MKKNLISFDYAMKNILRNKANFGVLSGLLTELLGRTVVVQAILESEGNLENKFGKPNRLDLKAQIDGGEIAIFEVQVNRQSDFFHRLLFGSSRAVVEQLYKGENYGKIKKIYSVSIVYFDLGSGSDYVYRGITEFRGVHKHDMLLLTKKEEQFLPMQTLVGLQNAGIIFPEYYIIYPERFNEQIRDRFDEWVYLLKTDSVESEFTAAGIQEAGEALAVEKMSRGDRINYEDHLKAVRVREGETESSIYEGILIGREEGRAEGEAKGRAEGLAEGEAAGILKTAKAMKAKGMDTRTIAEITGLPENELVHLGDSQTQRI